MELIGRPEQESLFVIFIWPPAGVHGQIRYYFDGHPMGAPIAIGRNRPVNSRTQREVLHSTPGITSAWQSTEALESNCCRILTGKRLKAILL